MGFTDELRVLVIDDIALVAQAVRSRIGLAANSPGGAVDVSHVGWLSITSKDVPRAVKLVEERIHNDRINVLVVDRGILDNVDDRRDPRSDEVQSYQRSARAAYVDILDIFSLVNLAARSTIKKIIIYTLDDLQVGTKWFADVAAIRSTLRHLFPQANFVDVVRMRTDVYQHAGVDLFNESPKDSAVAVAHAPDLKLYGAIAGEIVWNRIERASSAQRRAKELKLRSWFFRNYLVFITAALGAGVAGSAAYDLLRSTFTSISGPIIVGLVFGVVVPVSIIGSEPRLLLPPSRED